MLHTLPITGTGRTREDALAAAAHRANEVIGSIALLSERHVVSVTPTFLTDTGPQTVTLLYVLNVPAAIREALDERLAQQEVTPAGLLDPQKPGDAWLYSHGKWLPIRDPCHYPENWTIDLYRQELEAQGYRYERDFFDLGAVSCPAADEVTVGFAVYVAEDPEESEHRPQYPYRVEACLFLSDWEPPIYVVDYPSLLELLTNFAPIVQTRLRIAELVVQEQDAKSAD